MLSGLKLARHRVPRQHRVDDGHGGEHRRGDGGLQGRGEAGQVLHAGRLVAPLRELQLVVREPQGRIRG